MPKIYGFILVLGGILLGCSPAAKEVKIAFAGPMTGDAANYGKLMSQGVRLAVDERNANGGIGGNTVKLLIEDTEGKPEKATAGIEKLVSIDKISGLIGTVFSSAALVVAPRLEAEKIVMISPSASHAELTNKGKYIFRTMTNDNLQADVFARYVYQELGIKKLAVLYLKNDYSQGLAKTFEKIFKEVGGTVTAVESGLQGDKDFKTQLTRIKQSEPEALYIPVYVAEAAQILSQARQLGLRGVTFLGADGLSNPELAKLAGDQVNGLILSGPQEAQGSKTADFKKAYKEKFGVEADGFTLNAYDGAVILLDALQAAYDKASSSEKKKLVLSKETVQKAVAAVKKYDGVSGTFGFAPNGDALKNIGISEYENRKTVQRGVYNISSEGRLSKVE